MKDKEYHYCRDCQWARRHFTELGTSRYSKCHNPKIYDEASLLTRAEFFGAGEAEACVEIRTRIQQKAQCEEYTPKINLILYYWRRFFGRNK